MKEFSNKYYELLTGEYSGINLTRITDREEFYNKQIVDSVKPQDISTRFKNDLDEKKIMVDIGFGGGFPILPMAKKNPSYRFVGVETRGKKVKVVTEIATKLGLSNVFLRHYRIENIFIDLEVVCTFKAVGKVNDFLSKINTDKVIQVYFYKGPNFYKLEKDQIKIATKDWEIIEEVEIDVDGTDKRYLIGFQNKKVPCGTPFKSSNNLVKLSKLF